jgi:diguanylate cyclase (GGDEF)-like protein
MAAAQALQTTLTVLGPAFLAVTCVLLLLRSKGTRDDKARRLERQTDDLPLSVIEALIPAINAQDGTSPGHHRRSRILALEMGRLMGLAREDLQVLKVAALLHDIDTLATFENILGESGSLMKVVRARHEKFDGTGSPDRIAGERIPLAARILAVVVRFDALTSRNAPGGTRLRERPIDLIRREAGTSFDPRVVEVLARHLDRMEAMSSRLKTQEDALTDPLTRLPNARFLFASFQSELTRTASRNGPFSIIELDIDDFGAINDAHGHPAGDRILRGVARAVRGQMRECDTCVRYAGDEFIVTVPGVGREGIEAVQARITRAIETHKFAVARARPLRVTVSMGSATFPEDGGSLESLLAVADARLYARKSPNQVSSPDAGGYQRFSGRRDVPAN